MTDRPTPPPTPKRPVRFEKFGQTFIDDYAWIRQPTWFNDLRTPELLDPKLRAHIEAENAYCDAMLAPTAALQAEMVQEILRRSTGGDPPPEIDGGWAYAERVAPGATQPCFSRRPVAGGDQTVLLDADAEAKDKPYYRLSEFTLAHPSPDHRLFAWAADEAGDQHFRLYVKDIASGQLASSVIESCYGSFAFSPDSRWLYWVLRDEHSRPTKVFRRPAMGGEDVLVYEEPDPAFFIGVRRARSNACVFIHLFDGLTSEEWIIPGDEPTAAPRLIEARQPGVVYEIEPWGERFIVRTNTDGATNFKLMLADPANLGRAGWREWIEHRPDSYIAEIRAFRDHLVRLEWIDANPTLTFTAADGEDRRIAQAEPAYDLVLGGMAYDTATLRYVYQSPASPPHWIDHDMATGEQSVVAIQPMEGFEASDYDVRRLFARADDGAEVPITVLLKRGAALDGSAPLFLYGYGSYGYSVAATFSAANLSLVDRGWITAIAHIRGGGERGPDWYSQVIGTGKKASITDFIACADHLVAEGYTRAGKIVSHSLSAGGIVIGGSINLRPELWAGAIGQVPFVDVLNSLHDFTNPLIPTAYSVWGDASRREVFDYVASYSPYENVHPAAYPAVLAVAGLLDNRVGYWEAAKWAARLREFTTSGRPVLVRVNMTAGHQGHAGLLPETEQAAFFRAFAIWAMGAPGEADWT